MNHLCIYIYTVLVSQSCRVGRTPETSGKINSFYWTQYRQHNVIDELTDEDSGETKGL